jgi:hypothetical protein
MSWEPKKNEMKGLVHAMHCDGPLNKFCKKRKDIIIELVHAMQSDASYTYTRHD